MEVPDRAPAVSPDGRAVVFMRLIRGRGIDGAVARDAPEAHCWLPRGADAARTLRTVENGRDRIVAVAQGKLPARPAGPRWRIAHDFVTS
ncbi:hypothetical protein SB772_30895 [Paraburkholderia sp. SIMBA_030]